MEWSHQSNIQSVSVRTDRPQGGHGRILRMLVGLKVIVSACRRRCCSGCGGGPGQKAQGEKEEEQRGQGPPGSVLRPHVDPSPTADSPGIDASRPAAAFDRGVAWGCQGVKAAARRR